jgi:hypothetical protein
LLQVELEAEEHFLVVAVAQVELEHSQANHYLQIITQLQSAAVVLVVRLAHKPKVQAVQRQHLIHYQ